MVRSEGMMSLKNPVTPPGIDPGTVRLVAQRLNHYATPGPGLLIYLIELMKKVTNTAYLTHTGNSTVCSKNCNNWHSNERLQ
jgi:hypothetical protein